MRLYYMDAMRSILMMLGVVLHSASIYKANSSWLVSDEQTSIFFDWLVYFIHQFRMPAFFIVSGFFCHMTLTRYGSKVFLKKRLQRIVVPLVTCGLTLNSIQALLLHQYAESKRAQFYDISTISYWLEGHWVSHLWFLNCLIVYFLIAALLYFFAGKLISRLASHSGLNNVVFRGGAYILLLPLLSYSADVLSYRVDALIPDALSFLSVSEYFHYSIYFAFGFYLGKEPNLISEFSKPRVWMIILLLMFLVINYAGVLSESSLVEKLTIRYMDAFISWALCVICFFVFKVFFNRMSSVFLYLSDASYSVYLFHHLIVLAMGILLMNVEANPMIKFSAVLLVATGATLIIHHYGVLRLGIMRYLFNGKTLYKV